MSSRRDVRAFLWEVVDAADSILRFTEGVGEAAFIESGLIQAAVERKFIIIGEALNATAKLDPELADEIPDIARIIGFRNLLVHGYFEVDNRRVSCMTCPTCGLLLHVC